MNLFMSLIVKVAEDILDIQKYAYFLTEVNFILEVVH